MEIVFKVIGLAMLFVLVVIGMGVLMTLMLYPAWNWGVVPATGANAIGWTQTFWLALFISAVGQRFKPDKAES